MRKARPEGRHYGTVHETIDVGLTDRRISRVKIFGSDFGKYNAHIARQISVDRVTQLERRYLALQLDAGDLTFSVHTGIGSTRSVDPNFAIIQQRKDPHKFPLDRAQPVLCLPAV